LIDFIFPKPGPFLSPNSIHSLLSPLAGFCAWSPMDFAKNSDCKLQSNGKH